MATGVAQDQQRVSIDQHVSAGLKAVAATFRANPIPANLQIMRSKEFTTGFTPILSSPETANEMALFNAAETVTVNKNVTGVHLVRKEPPSVRRGLYYIHGGGLFAGNVEWELPLTYHLAAAFDATSAFSVEFRLCPDVKLSELVDDLVSGYLSFLAQGYSPDEVVVSGSSGGGMGVLYLLAELKHRKLPVPKVALAGSPHGVGIQHADGLLPIHQWPSAIADIDPFCSPSFATWSYVELTGTDEVRATASRLLTADAFRGITTKLLITVGATEVVVTANSQLAFLTAKAGVDVTFKIWPGGVHSQEAWGAFQAPEIAEARKFLASFVRENMQ
eukprot:TRINITY_DN10247_c0_g1_i1.p1 TRINITY_DN10247_c0_g1~~TRINITY_DN10247_c0_g1_i1.p1  ORF type:complete len:333 (-),score=59.27 TRINITY_DN10247_c0_g1_i1:180-1178(-)